MISPCHAVLYGALAVSQRSSQDVVFMQIFYYQFACFTEVTGELPASQVSAGDLRLARPVGTTTFLLGKAPRIAC